MTRDELEAVIRRALSDVAVAAEAPPSRSRGLTGAMNRATEAILDAAGQYASTEVGLLTPAERRRILFEAES